MIEVVCFTGNSGLTDYAVSLCRAWGARARLVTADSLGARFRSLGFDVLTPFRRSRHYPWDLLKFIRGTVRRRPTWSLWQGPLKFPLLDGLAARWLRRQGVRCAVTVHDVLPHYPRPWSRWTFGFYYRSFDRVIAHSEAAREGVRDLGVVVPVLVVPHGVYDLFCLTGIDQPAARRLVPGLADRGAATVVLFFGHLETRKGLFEFIEVAHRLRTDPRFVFLISGGISLSAADRVRLVEAAQRAGNVVLHAQRVPFEAVEHHFSAADLVALPYQEGTTSGVLKLAVAFGKPVIASAVGDFPEEIPPDAGRCVPLGEDFVSRFSLAIVDMSNDLPRWRTGMHRVADRLQWPAISERLERFLEEPHDA